MTARYECECCNLPLCESKSPGLGYYCQQCETHAAWLNECGHPGALFATHTAAALAIGAEHAQMQTLLPILAEQ